MEEKKFNCKKEVIPVIAGFVLESLDKDFADFANYSTVFTKEFIAGVRVKQAACYTLTSATNVVKLQKVMTGKIIDQSGKLRLTLNKVEGYLKLARKDLDIAVKDFGLRSIRRSISVANLEGLILNVHNFIATVQRNEAALVAKGMKPELLTTLSEEVAEIETLNTNQNVKKNERSRVSVDNIKVYNDLWEDLNIILQAGRAIYRGVDNVKLKEYTMSYLLKRVYNETSTAAKAKAAAKASTTTTTATTEEKTA